MGGRCAGSLLLGHLVLATKPQGAVASSSTNPNTDAGRVPVPSTLGQHCANLPESASAIQLLQCIELRRESIKGKKYEEYADTAEQRAMEHLQSNEEERLRQRRLPLVTPVTAKFREQATAWAQGHLNNLLIYVLGDEWQRSCEYTREQLGYRFSLEHWVYDTIMKNQAIRTGDFNAADYVYLPHCATGIFMHKVAKHQLQIDQDLASGRGRGRNNSWQVPAAHQDILQYEGNLPARPLELTESEYLLPILASRWSEHPAYRHCEARPTCRFLVVSIYGRHVLRRFADHFQDSAVFVTNAGMSNWLLQQPRGFYSAGNPGSSTQCRAACPAHCVRDPPAALPDDIVMPWSIRYHWTSRSALFESRDIMAFFSGTQNSCSRERLSDIFEASYEAQIQELKTASEMQARPMGERTLVFPAGKPLLQSEWSELAYRSRLCLCPDGDSPNTGRLIEVMMHGCVPMIISNRLQPPLHDYIDWSTIALFVAEDALPQLPSILRNLSGPSGMRRIARRHSRLARAAHLLHTGISGVNMLFFTLQDRLQRLVDSLPS